MPTSASVRPDLMRWSTTSSPSRSRLAPCVGRSTKRSPPRRGARTSGRPRLRRIAANLEVAQQPLDIFELELRAEILAEAPAQLLENAPRPLYVDLPRHLDRGVVAVVAPAQRPSKRVGFLLGTRRAEPPGLAVGAGTHHALLLHRLGKVLGATAHGFARAAELIHFALTLLALAEALLAQLFHQLFELVAQTLLVLAQVAHLVALLALL